MATLRDAGAYRYQDGRRGDCTGKTDQSGDKRELNTDQYHQIPIVNTNPRIRTSRDDSFKEETMGNYELELESPTSQLTRREQQQG